MRSELDARERNLSEASRTHDKWSYADEPSSSVDRALTQHLRRPGEAKKERFAA